MQIGEYELHSIETGRFRLDGGAMFGSVPKSIWQKLCPADDLNRIEMASRVLLLVGKHRRVIVDTGLGTKMEAKETQIFGYDSHPQQLLKELDAHGLKPTDITDVILTHLHFDHAGGATTSTAAGGVPVPTFPAARHYVQRAHWNHALKPNEKDRAGFKPGDFLPLAEAQLVELVDGETQLFEGVSLKVTQGHTSSLQLPLISDGHRTLFCCGDLVPTAAHLKPNYVMAFDQFPVQTVAEKRLLVGKAAAEGWILFLQHDPTVTCGVVRADGEGFTWASQSGELRAQHVLGSGSPERV